MRFTLPTTFTLTKKEFQKFKDIRDGEYSLDQSTIDKLTNLKLITNTNKGFTIYYVITKRGKQILKQK